MYRTAEASLPFFQRSPDRFLRQDHSADRYRVMSHDILPKRIGRITRPVLNTAYIPERDRLPESVREPSGELYVLPLWTVKVTPPEPGSGFRAGSQEV